MADQSVAVDMEPGFVCGIYARTMSRPAVHQLIEKLEALG